MRKTILFTIIILNLAVYCEENITIKNKTRPGGYAMGDAVALQFAVSGSKTKLETIDVRIFEKKTGYTYKTTAEITAFDDNGEYSCIWDGRKPDGSWPAGGTYWVYAVVGEKNKVVSDTVEIGLTD